MIWLRAKVTGEDQPDIEMEFVDLSRVPAKPGESLGPCLLLLVRDLPLQVDTQPSIWWGYWDGACWLLSPQGKQGEMVRMSDGSTIDARAIAGVVVLPKAQRGRPALLTVHLYETTTQ